MVTRRSTRQLFFRLSSFTDFLRMSFFIVSFVEAVNIVNIVAVSTVAIEFPRISLGRAGKLTGQKSIHFWLSAPPGNAQRGLLNIWKNLTRRASPRETVEKSQFAVFVRACGRKRKLWKNTDCDFCDALRVAKMFKKSRFAACVGPCGQERFENQPFAIFIRPCGWSNCKKLITLKPI